MSRPVKCENCSWSGDFTEQDVIDNLYDRVAGGEIMPSGQCPECGSLCHEPNTMQDALKALLERAEKGLDQSATHEGLLNCNALANARNALRRAGGLPE